MDLIREGRLAAATVTNWLAPIFSFNSALSGMLALGHVLPHTKANSVAKQIASFVVPLYNPFGRQVKYLSAEPRPWEQLEAMEQFHFLFFASLANLFVAWGSKKLHKYTRIDS